MNGGLRVVWGRLLGSLWFVPGLLVAGAILLAIGMIELSTAVDSEALARWPRVFGASADSSRSMLSAIASSMITVAGVTFSITMVAVTQASSQYTPRILRNFMRDRANQMVLGAFVGIFAYCLVVIRTIRGGDDEGRFVPSLAVLLGVVLAVVGIGVLIFFIHHISSTLQASGIVSRVAAETVEVVDRLFPETMGEEADAADHATVLAALARAEWRPAPAESTGYVQAIDAEGLVRAAREGSAVIRMARGVGEFVVRGAPVAWIAPHPTEHAARDADGREPDAGAAPRAGDDDDVAGKVASLFTVSTYRTVDQDAGFGVRQLVDIALKALSPGINDTTTAVTCIDYLGAILGCATQRRIETPYRADDGVLCVIARGPTFESLLRESIDEIRQNAGGNVATLARLLDTLVLVARATRAPARRALLAEQVELVREVAERTVDAPHDRMHLDARIASARGIVRGDAAAWPAVES